MSLTKHWRTSREMSPTTELGNTTIMMSTVEQPADQTNSVLPNVKTQTSHYKTAPQRCHKLHHHDVTDQSEVGHDVTDPKKNKKGEQCSDGVTDQRECVRT